METHIVTVHTRDQVESVISGVGLMLGVDYNESTFDRIYKDVVQLDTLNKGPVADYLVHSVRKRYM